jgi:hypothetical protein
MSAASAFAPPCAMTKAHSQREPPGSVGDLDPRTEAGVIRHF